jgi:hypothetical protein
MTTTFIRRFCTSSLLGLLLASAGACTFENQRPDLPLAVAPGFEVRQVPKPARVPAEWDRPAHKLYDDSTYVPPAEGSFPEGQAAHPFFRDPKPTGDGDGK